MNVIEARGLEKEYRDGTKAVKGVTFHVQKGEIFGLLGPNGAGKTTTMHILGTLHQATGGTAQVLGMQVGKQSAAIRKRIGFAMQEVGMDDLATAGEMLRFHGRLYGMSRADAAAKATELLHLFDLSAHENRRVTRFSGGMARRLDLAVSIIHSPDMLFLDEPSTGLDPTSRADLWKVLRKLRREHGLTILMSTHYMEEADELCDRIAIMNDGNIVAIDTPERLKRSVGADTISVQLKTPATPEDKQRLHSGFKGAKLHFDERGFHLNVRDGAQMLMPALRVVDAAGVQVVSTRVKTPTLDDVFLKYTGKRLEDEA